MNRVVQYVALTLTIIASQNVSGREREVPLVAGTTIQCTLNEQNLSSRSVKAGDPIVCYARPLNEFGCSVFSRGTLLGGRFLDYKEPGRLLGKGWMRLEFDRLIIPDGEAPVATKVILVHGFNVDSEGRILGRGHPKRDAVGWAIPLLWPIKLATLPLRGPRPSLKGEQVITLRLMEDVRVPCGGSAADPPRPGWHYFGSSKYHDAPDGLFGEHRGAGQESAEVLASETRQHANSGGSLVIPSGHHVVVVGPSDSSKWSGASESK